MTERGKYLAIIPARGGSKRLPRKNVLMLGGKPLIAWSIEAARTACCFADIVVSSDDDEILEIARRCGATIHRRGAELATDTTSTADVLLDVVEWLASCGQHYGGCVLLQPTSPLRSANDIRGALTLFEAGNGETVISVSEIGVPSSWCGTMSADGFLMGFDTLRGGEIVSVPMFRLNGAVYVFDCDRFRRERRYQTERNLGFVMPVERAVDIDTERDLMACEEYLASRSGIPKARTSDH